MSALDNPAWSSLCGPHQALSQGTKRARRYRPDVNLFAATGDDHPESLRALAQLARDGDSLCILQARDVVVPPGLRLCSLRQCVQLVLQSDLPPPKPEENEPDELGDADVEDMLALATLTRPGPFRRDTRRMGRFVGVRIDGRLAAMAGERFRFDGYTEVSGVCTHPDFRGRGLAASLSRHVAARILARGERPFLQSWSCNAQAIRLYQRLGFRIRRDMHVAMLERTD